MEAFVGRNSLRLCDGFAERQQRQRAEYQNTKKWQLPRGKRHQLTASKSSNGTIYKKTTQKHQNGACVKVSFTFHVCYWHLKETLWLLTNKCKKHFLSAFDNSHAWVVWTLVSCRCARRFFCAALALEKWKGNGLVTSLCGCLGFQLSPWD